MSETMTEEGFTTGEVIEPNLENYWGSEQRERWYFPDGTQYMEFKVMTEGDKKQYQRLTNQDLKIGRDQTASVRMDPGAERHILITQTVKDWNLYAPDKKTGKLAIAAFDKSLLVKWLEQANPKLVEDLEIAIRKANPWMLSDQSVEDIDKEIDRLVEMRKEKLAMESGEGSSANK
jgi:hypothetical protein